MSHGMQILHGLVLAPLFVVALAAVGTDGRSWPLLAGVIAVGTASFSYFSA